MDLSEFSLDKDLSRAISRLGLDDDLARITAGVTELEGQLDAISVTQVSPDRMVKVTVDGRMVLRALAIDPAVYEKQDAEALAASILATVQQAGATAAAKATAACEGLSEVLDD